MLVDMVAIIVARARKAQQFPPRHALIAAIERIGEEAFHRILQHKFKKRAGAEALREFEIDPAALKTLQQRVLLMPRQLREGFSVLGARPDDVPGYTSLMLILCLIGGVQLLALGTIGEYVGRIYTETKGRPNYVVKRTTGLPVSRTGPAMRPSPELMRV